MNRIILIGNGFDLAHGMKTGYGNFVEWLWEDLLTDNFEIPSSKDQIVVDKRKMIRFRAFLYDAKLREKGYPRIYDDKKFPISKLLHFVFALDNNNDLDVGYHDTPFVFSEYFEKGTNDLLISITRNYVDKGWSDVEQAYYDKLLEFNNDEESIINLNREFQQIEQALIEYLLTLPKPSKVEGMSDIILAPILGRDIKELYKKDFKDDLTSKIINFMNTPERKIWLEERSSLAQKFRLGGTYEGFKDFKDWFIDYLSKMTSKEVNTDVSDLISELLSPDKTTFLTFNYTDTEELYRFEHQSPISVSFNSSSTIHIHGKLNDPSNPIIFGYGDEYDDEYKKLEKSKIPHVLDNIKSMKYLETNNYRKLESLINAAPYQVYIMGHSCALSDNTLLRTLFEHENCVSIKPYYYQNEKGWDNYGDIIQALSRCFTDKSKLRSVVVNKTFCELLPQNKRSFS